MPDNIREIWKQIEFASSASDFPTRFNPSATPDMLEQRLSRVLGLTIPGHLRDSLLTHNGVSSGSELVIHSSEGCWQAIVPLSVDSIEEQWKRDRESQAEQEFESKRDGSEVSSWVTKPQWIPIFADAVGDFVIYLDSADGTIFNYCMAANPEVDEFRYPDYATFLTVILKHIQQNRWFDWGNGEVEEKSVDAPISLNNKLLKKLVKANKTERFIETNNGQTIPGQTIQIEDAQTKAFNELLASLGPVKNVRTPAQQTYDYVIRFAFDMRDYRIVVSVEEEGVLTYSVGNCQYQGGDSKSFRQFVTALGL